MGILGFFKKKRVIREDNEENDILTIPYDYDGYDLTFESDYTDPRLYERINRLLTNGHVDMGDIDGFRQLRVDSDLEEFLCFYDAWLTKLRNDHYVIHLDDSLDITAFTDRVNALLRSVDSPHQLDVAQITALYKQQVCQYSFRGEAVGEDFRYDVLEANVVAGELRKIGYELINFFVGCAGAL